MVATPNLTFSQPPVVPSQPSFSIAIRIPPVLKAQSEMLLEIAMTNTSNKNIEYAVVPGLPTWWLFQFDFRDTAGRPVLETPVGRKIRIGPQATNSVFGASLTPGKVLRVEMRLNRIYDLSRSVSIRFKRAGRMRRLGWK
jgi:hypothetical protein